MNRFFSLQYFKFSTIFHTADVCTRLSADSQSEHIPQKLSYAK